jgi:hypothetical protein
MCPRTPIRNVEYEPPKEIADRVNEVVRVFLVSDPDLPAELASRLANELPDLLARRLSADVEWRVRTVTAPLVGDEQLDVTDLVDVVAEQMPAEEWDVGVFLTDLPRRSGLRPVAAEIDNKHRLALVSIPTLGVWRLYRNVREAVVGLVAELTVSDDGPSPALRRRRSLSAQFLPAADGEQRGIRLVGSPLLGTTRMVSGMVRANQPWRLFLGLSRSLVGVFATAAYGLINDTAWQLGAALGGLRQVLLAVISVGVLVAWLIIDHELWERPTYRTARARAVLYNTTTVITLLVGVLCLYAMLFVVLFAVELLLLDHGVLAHALSHAPRWSDELAIVWFLSSASLIGGALGSGFEDDSVVRRAAYGVRQRQRQRQHQTDGHATDE